MPSEILEAEARLRAAMLASDVVALDALIHDRLMFIGPDGGVYSKADDLALYRSGAQRMSRVDFDEIRVERHGSTAITLVHATLAGVFQGDAFAGRYRYQRTWKREGDQWRVVGGCVTALPNTAAG